MNELATSEPPQGAAAESEPVIIARGLRREFGSEVALVELDLAIPPGLIFGFIGPSGSGKTTAVRLLAGIDVPTAGSATVLGHRTAEFDGRLRSRIGYMPQSSVQFPNLSVQTNMSFVASLYGLPLRRRKTIAKVLKQTDLYDHRSKAVRNLSGGMKRRLALSAALVHDPEVLFLDEPTAGIDPVLRRTLWDHFEHLRDQGRTLFITTQYVNEAMYCDRVGVLAGGRLIAEGPPGELRRQALGGDVLELITAADLDGTSVARLCEVEGVSDVRRVSGRAHHLIVDAATRRLEDVRDCCVANSIEIESLREVQPPFDDVFATLMRQHDGSDDEAVAG